MILKEESQIRCLNLIPRDTFQAIAQRKETQKRANILPELRRSSYEFKEARKASIGSTAYKKEKATERSPEIQSL